MITKAELLYQMHDQLVIINALEKMNDTLKEKIVAYESDIKKYCAINSLETVEKSINIKYKIPFYILSIKN